MSNVARKHVSLQDVVQAYWNMIDQDPEVKRRREAFERAQEEGRLQEESILPSKYFGHRRV